MRYHRHEGLPEDAVYNAPIHRMTDSSPRFLVCGTVLVVSLFFGDLAFSAINPWTATEQEFAQKIVAVLGPGPVALQFVNRSSLTPKDADDVRSGVLSQLARLGVQAGRSDQSGAQVRVTVSENVRSYVLVAEIRRAAAPASFIIVSCPREEASGLSKVDPPLVLRRTPLWTQAQPILDAALFEDNSGGSHLLVLGPEAVSVYRFEGGQWRAAQSLAIKHDAPWPRDLRGRLILHVDQRLNVFLPGILCAGTHGVVWTLECASSDDPWPLSPEAAPRAFFAPTRNFFTGVLSPGIGKISSTAKFYSAASIPRLNAALWLFSATDGSMHLVDGTTDQTAFWKWGSDLASLRSSCGGGTQVLATQAEDDGVDSVRAYEFPDRDPVPVSAPLEFSGSIIALWTESKGNAGLAVTRNLKTGNYEAFRLTVSCGQ